MRARIAAVAGVLLLVPAVEAVAGNPDLTPGSRIRMKVSGDKKWLVGELVALEQKSLRLRLEDEDVPRAYSRQEIVGLDVSAGRRSLGSRALWGGLAGAAAGAIAVVATSGSDDDGMFTEGEAVAMMAGLFGACGAVTGMLVIPGEKWQGVPLKDVRLSFRPPRGRGAGLFLTFGF